MFIAGIDEAGRGPVIGPMVIAGVMIEEFKTKKLINLNIKDSKELTREEREEIFSEIIKVVDKYVIKIIDPQTIDRYVYQNKLNLLELKTMSEIITKLLPKKVYIDSPSKNTKKVKDIIENFIKNKDIEIIVETKADRKYSVVSAASIIAKVTRDREIDKIKEKVGIDFGSGYPSDPRTKKAIKENYDKLRDYIRKSWKTVKLSKQTNLLSFIKFFRV